MNWVNLAQCATYKEENKMNETKKKYTAEGLLQFAYKHNQIPVVVFAKDKDCSPEWMRNRHW